MMFDKNDQASASAKPLDVTVYHTLFKASSQGICLHEIIYDASGTAVDYVILDVNQAFEQITGLPRETAIGSLASKLYGTGEPPFLDLYATVADTGEPATFEVFFPPMDKHFNILTVCPQKGQFATIFRDVTKHKQTEEELTHVVEEVQFLSDIARSITDSVVVTDTDFKISYVNKAAEELYGYSSNEIIGQSPDILNAEPTSEQIQQDIYAALSVGNSYTGSALNRRKDGSTFICEFKVSPIIDTHGATIGHMGVQRDVTELKQTESAFYLSENRYRLLMEASDAGIVMIDKDGRFLIVNRAATEIWGKKSEDMIGKHFTELGGRPKFNQESQRILDSCARGENLTHERYVAGLDKYFLEDVRPVIDDSGVFLGAQIMIRDITERKKAENALRQSEEKYRSIFENTGTATTIVEEDGTVTLANQKLAELSGYSNEEIVGKLKWHQFVAPEYLDAMLEYNRQRRINPEAVPGSYEFEYVTKSGTRGQTKVNVVIVPGTKQSLVSMIDITELKKVQEALQRNAGELASTIQALEAENAVRREAEQALRQSEENFRSLAEKSSDGISVAQDMKLVYTNYRVADWLGYTPEEFEKIPRSQLIHPDYRAKLAGWKRGATDSTFTFLRETISYLAKDGSKVDVEIFGTSGVWQGKPALLYFNRNVSAKQRAEEERMKSAKLESTGVLAGGIAHDFNNILTGILGNISLARWTAESGQVDIRLLEEAERATKRATGLTQQLLTFARGGEPVRKRTDIGQLIKESVRFSLYGSNVKGRYDIPEDLWQANVDEGQINQVVSNLVINALQAMTSGGVITVMAENVSLKPNEMPSLGKGNYVKVSIADNGTGIPPDILDKVFDPYFTTKGAGSGLGLASSYSIIQKHAGQIGAESTLKVGTTVTFYLPAMRRAAVKKLAAPAELRSGSGRVLLMDDEATIRNLGKRILEATGYTVEVAANGDEALKLYRQALKTNNPFDAVVLDLTVPGGKGGMETIGGILKLDPRAKVLVSSGYSNDPVMAEPWKYGFAGVLTKPYTTDEITRALGDVISE